MGWEDDHLYNFTVGHVCYGIADPEFEFDCKDSRRIKLEQVLKKKLKFIYVYDFGDNWEHEIRVEGILNEEQNKFYPVCWGGERTCPPEHVVRPGGDCPKPSRVPSTRKGNIAAGHFFDGVY